MIYDVIYSLVVLIEKLPFFNKQLLGFIISFSERQICAQISFQGIYQKLCIRCGTCPNLTTWIQQQCLPFRIEVLVILVNFGQVFALFLGIFIFNSEYSLFIVNVIKCYFLENLCKNIKYALYLRELLQYINLQLRQ